MHSREKITTHRTRNSRLGLPALVTFFAIPISNASDNCSSAMFTCSITNYYITVSFRFSFVVYLTISTDSSDIDIIFYFLYFYTVHMWMSMHSNIHVHTNTHTDIYNTYLNNLMARMLHTHTRTHTRMHTYTCTQTYTCNNTWCHVPHLEFLAEWSYRFHGPQLLMSSDPCQSLLLALYQPAPVKNIEKVTDQ